MSSVISYTDIRVIQGQRDMAQVNIIGVYGTVLSLACAGAFWVVAIVMSGWSSGMTDLERDVRTLTVYLAALYTIGAFIGLFSQLGAFLQIPCIAIGMPIAWYTGSTPLIYIVYLVGLLGASLLILAMFTEYSRADRELKAPPFSRVVIWRLGPEGPRARPLPKGMAKVVLAVFLACIIAIAAFAVHSWSSGVSDLRVEFVTDGQLYGSVNVSISVDGKDVHTAYIPYDPTGHRIIFTQTWCAISAGTHLIEVDVWNGADLDEGTVDTEKSVRILPFTTDWAVLGLGVGW